MRRLLPISLLIVLCLAACGGGTPTPTATTVPPTAAPSVAPTSATGGVVGQGQAVIPLPPGLDVAALPDVGTLSYNQLEGTPSGGTPTPYDITVVSYYQQGGITGNALTVVLYPDGRVMRNGVETRVSAEAVDQVVTMLEELRFLEIQGTFETGSVGADQFRYTVLVETAQGSKTVNSEDGLTPAPLLQLYDLLRDLGQVQS